MVGRKRPEKDLDSLRVDSSGNLPNPPDLKESQRSKVSPMSCDTMSQSSHPETSTSSPLVNQTTETLSAPPLPQNHENTMVQSLPKIPPLGERDAQLQYVNLAPILTDIQPAQSTNPRRSTRRPASFIGLNPRDTQDGSKSSVSSTFSNISAGSTGYTPISPIEEPMASRSLLPLHPSANQPYVDRGRELPHVPLAPVTSPPYVGVTPTQAFGTSCSRSVAFWSPHHTNRCTEHQSGLSKLAIHGNTGPDRSDNRSQSTPTHQDIRMGEASSSPQSDKRSSSVGQISTHARPSSLGQREQYHPQVGSNDPHQQLDPLSVLALAGHMVDRDPRGG